MDVNDILLDLRLNDYADVLIHTLAVGLKRKASLAVALSRRAKVFVLDEPTSGLDAVSVTQLWKLLYRLRETSTIIMTSNKSNEVDVLADQIVVLARGVIQLNRNADHVRRLMGRH